jgi:anthranilate/para-aminobenzoate synthase component I
MKSLTATHHIFSNLNKCLDDVGDYAYTLHIPALDRGWIGTQCSQVITYSLGEIIVSEKKKTEKFKSDPNNIWTQLRQILKPDKPYFFLISLDLHRSKQDVDLPLIIFFQPGLEVCVDGSQLPDVQVLAEDSSTQKQAQLKVQEIIRTQDFLSYQKTKYSDGVNLNITDWQGEPDESFLSRLAEAVSILQDQSDQPSKMIITRNYNKILQTNLVPFDLYKIYTLMEQNCASSHYFCMPEGVISLGCSPENVFELIDRKVNFDVIASTCKRSENPDEDARLKEMLLKDFKEDREHTMARNRSLRQIESLCVPNSIELVQDKNIRQLRNINHLYSEYSGTLQSSLDYLDLLEECFPPLTSYPPSLVNLVNNQKEPSRFYGGMVGRISPGTTKEVRCFNNLRSCLIKKNTAYIQGGVGVIKQSRPELEFLEVGNKLSCLLEAVALWEKCSLEVI